MTTSDGVLRLRGTTLGAGLPQVCVPVLAPTPQAAADAARALAAGAADVVELRLDHLTGSARDPALVRAAVAAVRAALPTDVPLLATFRSAREGGAQPADDAAYGAVVDAVTAGAAGPDGADAVDVELAMPGVAGLVARAQSAGLAVVVSHHDFAATPSADAIVALLRRQRDVGADVCKVAVMPRDPDDVLALLTATRAFTRDADRPVVTVAMGALGVVTRLAGGVFGSAMTFGSVGAASAPGQVDAVRLREVLALLHDAPLPHDAP
ncbi:type I 3-dehydroquinate dehydratase [Cellulomonas dongxiuzhuiae]|uniref:3-dehydroquinate dehydratase n=1 Tax=Cellulomonas dongxiuzhuiae TaxID=2819979 RepID=A0ABX8GIC6_9CELL|nr:type I 3-dehydroquinate dehydratase [Cellulomonas dongxiuzhuiae]MBO3089286.1 type I 3-dehydroquinate dehydratase [Cellulomonas dongxiuzhuiae]MBO3094929.1 type I 3-dehydroquinate dehydratase [Cellulomonas dongxiuzhuiae]QWC15953.1 type I 3-dehydroquinate dehydratase [Cellulomonas dongxiuzhuiae]